MGQLGFNISNFRSSINQTGIVRDHSFMVLITPPLVLSDYDTSQLTLRCDSVNIPGINLLSQDGVYRHGYGPAEKYPYGVNFSEVTMSFIVDKAASQYTFFNIWLNTIYNINDYSGGILGDATRPDSPPFEVEYRENYATDMHIFVYNEQTDKVIEVNFIEAWPRMIQDTPVSWGNSSYIRIIVSMCYKSMFIKTLEGYPDKLGKESLFDTGGILPSSKKSAPRVFSNIVKFIKKL